jgi:hypothetical protein
MSNWYNFDEKSKKALIILMERSKNPILVTAGKILDLSLETFATVIDIQVYRNIFQSLIFRFYEDPIHYLQC